MTYGPFEYSVSAWETGGLGQSTLLFQPALATCNGLPWLLALVAAGCQPSDEGCTPLLLKHLGFIYTMISNNLLFLPPTPHSHSVFRSLEALLYYVLHLTYMQ